MPQRSIAEAANGPMSAEERDVDGDGGRDGRAAPAELRLERHHQQARRRADAGGDEEDREGDERDDPGVVQSRRQPPRSATVSVHDGFRRRRET